MPTPEEKKVARARKRVQEVVLDDPRVVDILEPDLLRDVQDLGAVRGSPMLERDTQRAVSAFATRTGNMARGLAEVGFDPQEVAAQRAQERQMHPLTRAAMTSVAEVLGALDTVAARPVRKVAAAAYDIPQESTKLPETFHATLQQRKGPAPVAAIPFEAVRGLGGEIGERVGGAMDLGTSVIRAFENAVSGDDIPPRTQAERDLSRQKARRTGETFAFDAVFDLTNLLGLGLPGKASKSIAASAARAGGLDEVARAQLAEGLRQAAQTVAIPERLAQVKSTVQAATKSSPQTAAAVEKKIADLIGPTGSRLDVRPVTFAGMDVVPAAARARIDKALGYVSPALTSANRQRRDIETLARSAGQAEFRRSTVQNVEDMKKRIAAEPALQNAQAVDDAVKARILPGTSNKAAAFRETVFGPHAPAPGAMGPWPVMGDRGQKALDAQRALTDLFQSYEPRIQALGVKPQPNKTSGLYYPSNVVGEPERTGFAGEMMAKLFGRPQQTGRALSELDLEALTQILSASPGLLAKHGGNVQNLKKRASDMIARGDPVIVKRDPVTKQTITEPNPSFKVPVDLGADLGQYADVIARAEGFERNMKELERLFGKPRGEFPVETQQALTAQFPSYYEAMQRTLDRAKTGRSDLDEALDMGASGLDVANKAWRFAALTANPAHMTKNLLGDATLGMFGGGVTPTRYLEAATPEGLARARNPYGVGETGFLQRSDLPGNERQRNIFELQRAAGEDLPIVPRAVEALGEARAKLPEKLPLGTTFGDWWEGVNKRAIYLDSLNKGLGPDQAALRALTLGIDYNAPLLGVGGRGARLAQANLWPFARYEIGATKALASEFPGNLARAQLVPKALRAENQNQPNLAPTEVARSGYALPITNEVRDLLNQIPRLVGGEPLSQPPNVPLYMGVPQGQLDALGLTADVLQAARGAAVGQPTEIGRLLLSRAAEPIKLAGESIFGLDARTMGRPEPDIASPAESALGLAGLAVPAPARYPMNVISSRLGGPDRLVGGTRDVDPLLAERALPFATNLLGFPVMPASPQSRVSEILNSPHARELDEIQRALSKYRTDLRWSTPP